MGLLRLQSSLLKIEGFDYIYNFKKILGPKGS